MKKTLLSIFVLFLLPLFVHAATVSVEVDTGAETVNAIEGTLVLPTGVSIEDIYTGDSAILIWITRPTFDAEKNSIIFAGLSPGGFRGRHPLFSLEGPNVSALQSASFNSVNAYKNDGEGTEVAVRFSFSEAELEEDVVPPEPFSPSISSSPDLFEGRYFISFATQDKGTGIMSYEYAATWLFSPSDDVEWRATESPQALSRLESFQRMHVRAVDQRGNFRAVSTAGPYWPITFSIGLIIATCVALFITRSLRSYS